MPKKVLQALIQDLETDIRRNYAPGGSYRTVRQIASRFNVSLQSAHKAVRSLAESGMVEAKPKAGISILSHHPAKPLANRTLLVASAVPDRYYNAALIAGAQSALAPFGAGARLWEAPYDSRDAEYLNSLAFAAVVEEQYRGGAHSGICAVAFRHSVLPLYHLHMNGIPVVSNLEHPQAPILSMVAIDLGAALGRAVEYLATRRKRCILTVGTWTEQNPRFARFAGLIEAQGTPVDITHVCTESAGAMPAVHRFFESFSEEKAVFVLDFCAARFILPYFTMSGVCVRDNLLMFDQETDETWFRGDGPIPSVAPCVQRVGARMAGKLAGRIVTGEWGAHLREYI